MQLSCEHGVSRLILPYDIDQSQDGVLNKAQRNLHLILVMEGGEWTYFDGEKQR